MRRIDFSKNGGLKFTQGIASLMQETYTEIFKAIGAAFGNKVILSGCAVSGGTVSDGWILYNGEPIKFIGSAANTKVSISEAGTGVVFKNGISNTVLFNKTATCGAIGAFDFSELRSIRELAALNEFVTTLDTNLTALSDAFTNYVPDWSAIENKPSAYISYRGSETIGDVGTSGGLADTIVTIVIPPQGSTDYTIAGSLLGQNTDLNYDNDVSWVVGHKTASSFQLALREYSPAAQNLKFEFAIIKTS
jgi:hypothetical protein